MLFVSVPEAEMSMFSRFCDGKSSFLLSDESYAGEFLSGPSRTIGTLSSGYIDQEICKLNFYRTGVCGNYLCLDADCVFIRDFRISDFMAEKSVPYTVLHQDKDLLMDPVYSRMFGEGRAEMIRKIWDFLGLSDTRYRTCHGVQNMNCRVLASLYDDFMRPRGLSYADLLEIAPLEFSWYNAYFQKCQRVKEYAVEPFFKYFHTREEYFFAKVRLLTLSHIASQYAGIVLQSNWHKEETEKRFRFFSAVFSFLYRLILHFLYRGK